MSTILNALRRVEEDEAPAEVQPALGTEAWDDALASPKVARSQPDPPPEAVTPNGVRALPVPGWSLVLGVGVLLIGLGGWLVVRNADSTGPLLDAPPLVAESAPNPPPVAVPSAVQQSMQAKLRASAAPPVRASESDEVPVPSSITTLPLEPAPAAAKAPVQRSASPPPLIVKAADTAPGPVAEPSRPPVAKRAPEVAPSPAPKPSVKPTPPQKPVSVAVVAPMPDLHVVRTQWHPSAERRTARVEIDRDPLELKEGDTVHAVRVVEIRPTAVVFEFEGSRVERRVGKR